MSGCPFNASCPRYRHPFCCHDPRHESDPPPESEDSRVPDGDDAPAIGEPDAMAGECTTGTLRLFVRVPRAAFPDIDKWFGSHGK